MKFHSIFLFAFFFSSQFDVVDNTIISGDVFIGHWWEGYISGEGVFTLVNGDVFRGSWSRSTPEGIGTLISSNFRYVIFLSDAIVSSHILRFSYDGTWKSGLPHGRGRLEYADGKYYDGEWRMGKKHGEGLMDEYVLFCLLDHCWSLSIISGDGKVYNGSWLHGVSHGHGVEVVVFHDNTTQTYSGFFLSMWLVWERI